MPKTPSQTDHPDPLKVPLSRVAKTNAETNCFRHGIAARTTSQTVPPDRQRPG
jgi:hypothetical protein